MTDLSNNFQRWLASSEGQRALSHGISLERQQIKETVSARQIATDHLKKDRQHYRKLEEGIYDNKETWEKDVSDDLEKPEQEDREPSLDPGMLLALQAIESPYQARKYVMQGERFRVNMIASLKKLFNQTISMTKQMQGMQIAESVKGSGKPMKARASKKGKAAERLKLGSPADSSMVGTNPMIPGRSSFAKGAE